MENNNESYFYRIPNTIQGEHLLNDIKVIINRIKLRLDHLYAEFDAGDLDPIKDYAKNSLDDLDKKVFELREKFKTANYDLT